jgi:glycosyltransferase involved in cell wall biosynthesis
MRILHVFEAAHDFDAVRQLQLLAPLCTEAPFHLELCCLDRAGAWAEPVHAAGIPLHELRWTRRFDPGAWWRLRELLRNLQPDLIHAWGRPALRAVALAAPRQLGRVVSSAPLSERHALPAWELWLLTHVRCLAVADAAEQQQASSAGAAQRIEMVAPAADWRETPEPASAALPDHCRRVVCLHALEPGHGARAAVWALDILNHLYPDLHLVFAGAGPEQAEVRAFTRSLHKEHQVHFLDLRADIGALLRSAAVCWVPSQANVGRAAALEAMAHGCAVIAADVPALRDVVVHGETGYLVPAGEAVAFARRTRLLLDDTELRTRLGRQAAVAVRERHAAGAVAQRWRELYCQLAA